MKLIHEAAILHNGDSYTWVPGISQVRRSWCKGDLICSFDVFVTSLDLDPPQVLLNASVQEIDGAVLFIL